MSCDCLCRIPWSQMLSREWRCSWSSADTGDAPTTSEWLTILLPNKVRLILRGFMVHNNHLLSWFNWFNWLQQKINMFKVYLNLWPGNILTGPCGHWTISVVAGLWRFRSPKCRQHYDTRTWRRTWMKNARRRTIWRAIMIIDNKVLL